LAAKDTIGNFFGSVAIFLDRPFQIGDWVSAGSDVEGTVEHVGFRSTQIRTIRDTVVTMPNQKLAELNIDNWGVRRARRVRVTAQLAYATSAERLEAFCDGVRAILAAHPHTRKDDVEVHVNDFADSSLNCMVHFYVVRPTWSGELRARHEILVDIVRLAKDLGVSFAFPTRTVAKEAAVPDDDGDEAALLEVIRAYGPGGAKSIAPGPRILPAPPAEPVPAPKEESAPPRTP
jgi:MscS family membrane protein